jgi:hypothetical protein
MNRDEWRDEFTIWLEGFPWLWFCTLTFRPGLSPAAARWRLRKWFETLQGELGTAAFQWVAIPERGRTGLDFHYHALVAGLCERHAPHRMEWMRRWQKIGGDARIDTYRPTAGGVSYILKQARPEDMDDFEIHLKSNTHLQTTYGVK